MRNKDNDTKRVKAPWPTKMAMEQVYAMKLWGGNHSDFYSGEGSHHPEIVKPYIDVLTGFLTAFKNPLVVCDLGCGDFNIGKQLVRYTKRYVGVDIVPDLITRNKEQFKADNLEFQCLDLAADELPTGDCAIVRQVLQHLSNSDIQTIVAKLASFKYVIITEHIPEGEFTVNTDILSGQGTRLKKASGVNILAPPFHMKVKQETLLGAVRLKNGKGVIVTHLYSVF